MQEIGFSPLTSPQSSFSSSPTLSLTHTWKHSWDHCSHSPQRKHSMLSPHLLPMPYPSPLLLVWSSTDWTIINISLCKVYSFFLANIIHFFFCPLLFVCCMLQNCLGLGCFPSNALIFGSLHNILLDASQKRIFQMCLIGLDILISVHVVRFCKSRVCIMHFCEVLQILHHHLSILLFA